MNINEILSKMNFVNGIELNEMPELDLYMDQVIQLFENKLGELKRNDEEKILTKTMINNYAKGKLLLPIKNKKYSKEHLILMSLIYNLKGALSISDIKTVLEPIISSYNSEEEYPIRELYECYLEESAEEIEMFKNQVSSKIDAIEEKVEKGKNFNGEFEKQFLLICSLVNMSNMYRRMSEKIIEEIFSKEEK